MLYRIFTYDLWGNARDGWDVNDVYPGPVVRIADARIDAKVARALRAAGVIGRHVRTASLDMDGDETVYVMRRGRPVCELRPVEG